VLVVSLALAADLAVGPGQAYTTVQDAVQDASDGDRVLIDPGIWDVPATQVNGRAITLQAAQGAGTATLRATTDDRMFRTNAGGLTFIDLELDGRAARRIVEASNADVTLQGCSVTSTSSLTTGGALDVQNGDVRLEQTSFGPSTAAGDGGHVAVRSGTLTVIGGVFEQGQAANGGSLHASQGTVVAVTDATFSANVASGQGGGLWSDGPSSVTGTRFEANQATRGAMVRLGGAGPHALTTTQGCANAGSALIALDGGTTAIERLVLFDNPVVDAGIAVAAGATATVRRAHLVGNTASGSAAAMDVAGTATLTHAVISRQTGPGPAVVVTGALGTSYNVWFANLDADASIALGATDRFVDPRFSAPVTVDCDPAGLVPFTDSPLIDGGDPALLDTDGSTADIGAFGDLAPIPAVDDDADGSPVPFDCDDTNPDVSPLSPETPCNGLDDDCEAATLDDEDADADGVGLCALDCDDGDALAFPGATEIPYDGIDQDCDGVDLDDLDQDGALGAVDCDDQDPARSPDYAETTCTGIDEDCDPATIDDTDADADGVGLCDSDCDDADPLTFPAAPEIPYDAIDQDCDGADLIDVDGDGYSGPRDCDDQDAAVNPGAADLEGDGVDQDCTGADATSALTGQYGARCGCQGAPGVPWFGLVGLLWIRRRPERSEVSGGPIPRS
jgi:hypothetical protein